MLTNEEDMDLIQLRKFGVVTNTLNPVEKIKNIDEVQTEKIQIR